MSFNQCPPYFPSLCIPHVFANITERRIFDIFNKLGLGDIERIVIVPKAVEQGKKFNCVFIHWKYWFNNRNADTARQRILDGQDFKVIYDDPWFWKVYEYKPQPEPTVLHNRTVPRVVFEDAPRPRYLPVQEPRPIRSTQLPCPDKEYRRDRREEMRREEMRREEMRREEMRREEMRREEMRREENKRREQEEMRREEREDAIDLTREEIYALEVADTVAKNTRQLAPPPMSKTAAKLNAMKKV